tara:strand:- start:762 stop:974 length:213 start_codon:yes stop_codon:yes gene_type:complete
MLTGKKHSMNIDVTEEQISSWEAEQDRISPLYFSRRLIQDAFPNLSADEREFIKTGITPEEWDNMCQEEE